MEQRATHRKRRAPAVHRIRGKLAGAGSRLGAGMPGHRHQREVLPRSTSQAWSLALGYNHPRFIEAAIAQIRTLQRGGLSHDPRLLLAKRLGISARPPEKVVNAPPDRWRSRRA